MSQTHKPTQKAPWNDEEQKLTIGLTQIDSQRMLSDILFKEGGLIELEFEQADFLISLEYSTSKAVIKSITGRRNDRVVQLEHRLGWQGQLEDFKDLVCLLRNSREFSNALIMKFLNDNNF